MKILIVDDDTADRKIIIKALFDAHQLTKITETNSVAQALAAIEREQFDVILLDYKMPEANGIELLYDLRSRSKLGSTAVVMLSSSEDIELALVCIEAGAQDFLVKSEISQGKLSKAILHAKKRFEIEQQMHDSYITVKRMAERDPLTGLSNRYHFEETLKVMIANNKRTDHRIALLAFDLDNFKHVNDTLGHDAGDALLMQMVARINNCLRENEGFARLGGDEFAVILGGIEHINDVSAIAERILKTCDIPFKIKNIELQSSISIGVAIFPADAKEAEALVKSADIAMYRAKQSGKNRVCYYETRYQDEFNRRYAMQNDMNRVIKSRGFVLNYQALFHTNTHKIKGFEALLRWPTQDISNYTPDEFIPVAEETDQISKIGMWVFDAAISQLKTWQERFDPSLTMSINVSPVQLQENSFFEFVKSTLEYKQVSASTVTLEITETAFFKENEIIQKALMQLREYGLNIALDDFGMGYSSISHLISYPINIVKIDKALQANAGNRLANEALFEALTLMLKKLEFEIVAEGVENKEQLALCEKFDVDIIQGYLLGHPQDPKTSEALLRNHQS
jgi:diguanylate cyclase (GGDEF)-like protein